METGYSILKKKKKLKVIDILRWIVNKIRRDGRNELIRNQLKVVCVH